MTEKIRTREEAIAFLTLQANKQGKTLQEFLETDIREILEVAWAIQIETKKPVSMDALLERLGAKTR